VINLYAAKIVQLQSATQYYKENRRAFRYAVNDRLAVPSVVYTQSATGRFRLPPEYLGQFAGRRRIFSIHLYLLPHTENCFV